jgi:hypothetical protein
MFRRYLRPAFFDAGRFFFCEEKMHTQNHAFQNAKNSGYSKSVSVERQFAGIAGVSSEESTFLKMTVEPKPLIVIDLKLKGALFNDSVFLDQSSLEKVLFAVVRPLAAVMEQLQATTGSSMTAVKVSRFDSQIVVLPKNVLSDRERLDFLGNFKKQLALIDDEMKILRRLAEYSGEKFEMAWFRDNIRPSEELLQMLNGVVALEQALAKTNTYLCLNGVRVDLPNISGLKLIKKVETSSDLVGTICCLNSKPSTIVVQSNQANQMVTLQAHGKGYIDELNQHFRIGHRVRVSYKPIINILKPAELIPTKGQLVEIDAV